jgi:hypothetical protein
VTEKNLLIQIRTAADRLHLTDNEIAVLSGISLPTASAFVRKGQIPKTAHCVRGITLFAQRAAIARSRAELGLP